MYWTACSRHSAWGSKRLDQRSRLRERLLILRRGLGIPDDARARVERRLPSPNHDGANRNVEVHRAGHRDVADRATVDAAWSTLELHAASTVARSATSR